MAHIKTCLRVKPTRRRYEDFDCTNDKFYIRVPEQFREQSLISLRSKSAGTVNQEFQFKQVFDSEAEQKEVFDHVAKDIVQGFLSGYNGTIFAYGQTGTGKTYTMEGGNRRYEDRGLAPRALSMIYAELESFPDDEITVHISFLEIYQEVGYDLLNTSARSNSLVTHFPKVAVVEGPKGSCVIRNLATHLAANEEVAQSLLLQGLANRKVAETSMNLRSSRSHAVFTIMLNRKKPNSDVITRSKLHLVDLAGSERVAKSRIDGMQLAEAKYINLSLHYLEGVIIALQQEACGMRPRLPSPNLALYNRWVNSLRPSSAEGYRHSNTSKHIPYRNSLLTMVLRDSLGGNCQTAMIATVTLEEEHLYETLSTCRFAQRVACITNTLKKNEEIDDKSMIRRLRRRIAELETELAMLRSGKGGDPGQGQSSETLNQDDLPLEDSDPDCFKIVQGYLSGKIRDPITAGVNNAPRFRECFRILKKMILEHYVKSVAHDHDLQEMTVGRKGQSSEKTEASGGKVGTTVLDLKPSLSYKPLKSEQPREPTRELQRSNRLPPLVNPERPNSAPAQKLGADPSMRPGTAVGNMRNNDGSRNAKTTQQTSPAKSAYKSPYERRRESDIKKLNAKVEKVQETQQEQKRHLMEFQQNVQEQQLQVLRSEVKKKLDGCVQQYTDQQAYTLALKQSHAETDLLSQEQLIEKQIRKRKHKMEKRLQLLDSQIEKLKTNPAAKATPSRESADKENETGKAESEKTNLNRSRQLTVTPKKTASVLEEKFSDSVNRDGRLNSRQVLEMLQKQERQQEKVQENLEKNRVFTLTKQIEVKEAATRLKLQEFRDRLRQSRGETSAPGPRLAFGPETTDDAAAEPKLQIPQYKTDSNVIVNVGKADDVGSNITTDSVESTPNSRISSGAVQRDPNPGIPFSRAFRKGFAAPPRGDIANYINNPQKPAEKWNNVYNVTSRPVESPSVRSDIFAGISIKPTLQSSPIPDLDYEDLPTIDCSEIEVSPGRELGQGDTPRIEPKEPSFSWQTVSISDSLKNNVDDREEVSIDSNVFISKPADGASLEKNLPVDRGGPLFQPFNSFHHDPFVSSQEHRRVLKELQTEKDKDKVPVFKRSVTFSNLSKDIQRPLRTRITADDTMPQRSEGSKTIANPSEFSSPGSKTDSDHRSAGMTNKNFEDALTHMLGSEGEKPQLTFSHEHYDKFARRPKQGTHTGKMMLKTKATPVKSSPQISSSSSPKSTLEKKPLAAYVSKSAGLHRVASASISERLDKLLEMDPFRNYDEGKSLEESDVRPYRTPNVIHDGIATPPVRSSVKPQPKLDLDVDNFTPKIKAFKETEREEAFTRSVKEQKERVTRIRKARKAAEVIQDAWRKYSQRQGVNQGQVKIKYVHYKS